MTSIRLSVSILAVAALVGCASKTPAPETEPAKTDAASKSGPEAKAATPEMVQRMLANFQRVHFDLDSTQLDSKSQEALRANVEILRTQGGVRVEIQGHADERGTSEYNISLGDRRAKSVRDFMVHSGVDPKQLETISYGEEKPVASGENESAWAENRRAEFRVLWGQESAAGTVQ